MSEQESDAKKEQGDLRTFKGVARNVHRRSVKNKLATFRLEEVDDVGNVTASRVVECHAIDTDIVTDGDQVKVVGRVKEDGAILPQKIENKETGLTVEAPSGCYEVAFVFRNRNLGSYLLMGFIVAFFIFVLVMLLFSFGGPPS